MTAKILATELIKRLESFSRLAYPDADGYSIGYGFFGAKPGDSITLEEADARLEKEIEERLILVKSKVRVELSSPQLAALVSFHYNVGEGQFNKSTLLQVLNEGKYSEVPTQLRRWTVAQDQRVHLALAYRREQEVAMWLTCEVLT